MHSALPLGLAYTTAELHVNLIKGLRLDTPTVTAEGKLVSLGRRVATASGRPVRPDDTLYAHATTTCLIFEPRAVQLPDDARPEGDRNGD